MKKKHHEVKNSGANDQAPAKKNEQLAFDWIASTHTPLEEEEDSRQEEDEACQEEDEACQEEDEACQEEDEACQEEDELAEKIKGKLQGVLSENTLRSYLADIRNFMGWCRSSGHQAIPAEVDTLVAYVEWMGTQYKAATIRRRLDSLGSVFRYLRLPNATKDPDVDCALKRCFRMIGRHQKQARPLTKKWLIPMLKTCGNDVRGLRNRVLLQLGYESLRRRSEFCSLRFEDIGFYPNGAPYLLLRYSKTDQFGKGHLIPISQELYELIKRWRRKIGAEDGFILRSVRKDSQVGESLNPQSVNVILRDIQMEAFGCKDKEYFTGHSFRVGRAIDLLEEGENLGSIIVKAGWKTESTAVRYLRNYTAQMHAIPPNPRRSKSAFSKGTAKNGHQADGQRHEKEQGGL